MTSFESRPLLFVTNYAPPERIGAFSLLAQQQNAVFALFGGRLHHATGNARELPFKYLELDQRQVYRLASSQRFRAVICGTSGRIALPGAYLGARRAGVPFLLWSALRTHPKTFAHAFSYLPLRHIYCQADAIVTYGPHVSAYVSRLGARNVHEAPQSVDNNFWSAQTGRKRTKLAPFELLFVGRLEREKGIEVLLDAWQRSSLGERGGKLLLAGRGSGIYGERLIAEQRENGSVVALGAQTPEQLRDLYASVDVVVVPSIGTRTALETWSLVANEAMNSSKPIVATDAVGAVVGGLIRDRRNGLVVPQGSSKSLAAAIVRLYDNPDLSTELGSNAAIDVGNYTHTAWVNGFVRALRSVDAEIR